MRRASSRSHPEGARAPIPCSSAAPRPWRSARHPAGRTTGARSAACHVPSPTRLVPGRAHEAGRLPGGAPRRTMRVGSKPRAMSGCEGHPPRRSRDALRSDPGGEGARMGVRSYPIRGVSGIGKTAMAEDLQRRRHCVLHGDGERSCVGDPVTGAPLDEPARGPLADTAAWRHERHPWDVGKVRSAVAAVRPPSWPGGRTASSAGNPPRGRRSGGCTRRRRACPRAASSSRPWGPSPAWSTRSSGAAGRWSTEPSGPGGRLLVPRSRGSAGQGAGALTLRRPGSRSARPSSMRDRPCSKVASGSYAAPVAMAAAAPIRAARGKRSGSKACSR